MAKLVENWLPEANFVPEFFFSKKGQALNVIQQKYTAEQQGFKARTIQRTVNREMVFVLSQSFVNREIHHLNTAQGQVLNTPLELNTSTDD